MPIEFEMLMQYFGPKTLESVTYILSKLDVKSLYFFLLGIFVGNYWP